MKINAHLRSLTILALLLFAGTCVALWLMAEAQSRVRMLETFAELDMAPGNITVTPNGDVIISLHQHFEPELRQYLHQRHHGQRDRGDSYRSQL